MKRATGSLGRGLEWCGVLILVAVCLPLVAGVTFLLRTALVVGAVLALVSGSLLYCAHPGFRHWTHRVAGGAEHGAPAPGPRA